MGSVETVKIHSAGNVRVIIVDGAEAPVVRTASISVGSGTAAHGFRWASHRVSLRCLFLPMDLPMDWPRIHWQTASVAVTTRHNR